MNYERVYLGGVVDHGQIWQLAGDATFHEVGDGSWRTTAYTAAANGWDDVSASLHIRSGDSSGHSRLYNKFYIEQLDLTTGTSVVSLDSESLWEGTAGYGDQVRFFDGSRTWVDGFRVIAGHQYQYRVMALDGDTLHVEVSSARR